MKHKLLFSACFIVVAVLLAVSLASLTFPGDQVHRRVLKFGGALAALLGLAGIAAAGYSAGKSYDSYTGWGRFPYGADMF